MVAEVFSAEVAHKGDLRGRRGLPGGGEQVPGPKVGEARCGQGTEKRLVQLQPRGKGRKQEMKKGRQARCQRREEFTFILQCMGTPAHFSKVMSESLSFWFREWEWTELKKGVFLRGGSREGEVRCPPGTHAWSSTPRKPGEGPATE